jgi:Protein of unknown function (DUF3159)
VATSADDRQVSAVHFHIPDLRTILRHAVPRFVEGTLIPLALLLITLRMLGTNGAMVAGLVWVYSAIGLRLALRRPVPGILLLGAATLTARTVVAMLSGSIVVYFLQPSLGTALVAAAFLVSVPLNRPLAAKLASDFCPLPDDVRTNTHVRRFFRQISLLWAFTQGANAAITIWLLLSQSVGTFMVARVAVSWTLTITAIACSALWFRHSMGRHGIVVHLPRWRTGRRAQPVAEVLP